MNFFDVSLVFFFNLNYEVFIFLGRVGSLIGLVVLGEKSSSWVEGILSWFWFFVLWKDFKGKGWGGKLYVW